MNCGGLRGGARYGLLTSPADRLVDDRAAHQPDRGAPDHARSSRAETASSARFARPRKSRSCAHGVQEHPNDSKINHMGTG
jgi:hypothetical protein